MVGQGDREAPHEACALWLVRQNPAFQLELFGRDVGHYVFLCEATEIGRCDEPVICADGPGVDRRAIHDQAAAMAERLFKSAMS